MTLLRNKRERMSVISFTTPENIEQIANHCSFLLLCLLSMVCHSFASSEKNCSNKSMVGFARWAKWQNIYKLPGSMERMEREKRDVNLYSYGFYFHYMARNWTRGWMNLLKRMGTGILISLFRFFHKCWRFERHILSWRC